MWKQNSPYAKLSNTTPTSSHSGKYILLEYFWDSLGFNGGCKICAADIGGGLVGSAVRCMCDNKNVCQNYLLNIKNS